MTYRLNLNNTMTHAPLISIIVPCYNQAQYLDECLESVLNQTFSNWECIIVNDGSPDHTEDIAKKWCEKDSRFIYLNKENGGLSSARNAGITIAKGEWILPLDSDDKIGSQYLELAEKEFNKGYSLIYCKAELFGARTGAWNLPEFDLKKLSHSNMIFCTAFFKKEDWTTIGGYDEKMIYGYEDWEFWINLLKDGNKKVLRLDSTLFFYRTKEESMVTNLKGEIQIKMFKIIEQKHLGFFHRYSSLIDLHNQVYDLRNIRKEYMKIKNSKRYSLMNKIFNILNI